MKTPPKKGWETENRRKTRNHTENSTTEQSSKVAYIAVAVSTLGVLDLQVNKTRISDSKSYVLNTRALFYVSFLNNALVWMLPMLPRFAKTPRDSSQSTDNDWPFLVPHIKPLSDKVEIFKCLLLTLL